MKTNVRALLRFERAAAKTIDIFVYLAAAIIAACFAVIISAWLAGVAFDIVSLGW
jgi:hypothetical protein